MWCGKDPVSGADCGSDMDALEELLLVSSEGGYKSEVVVIGRLSARLSWGYA